jgi:hypothetical protein
VADAAFVSADEVIFKTGSSQTIIDLQEDRSVSGVVFESDYTLSGNQLRVLSGNILVEADVTATIDSDLAAEVSGSSLRKRGEGTLVVNGQAGQTVVLQGTVAGQGAFDHLSVYPGGSVTPGIAGVGQLSTGGYVQRPGGRLMLEIRADNSDLESDLLASSGQASLSGELWVQPIDGYADPAENGQLDEFTLVAGSIMGAFDTVMYDGEAIVVGHQGEGLFRLIEYHDDRVQWLNYRALAGDANGDRAVDFEDFTILADSFAQEGEWTDGDFDGDGIVQFPDFTVLADGFGSAVEPAVPVAVPEPGGFVLLLAASGAGLVLARRRAAY